MLLLLRPQFRKTLRQLKSKSPAMALQRARLSFGKGRENEGVGSDDGRVSALFPAAQLPESRGGLRERQESAATIVFELDKNSIVSNRFPQVKKKRWR